jgi:hypothetical protein
MLIQKEQLPLFNRILSKLFTRSWRERFLFAEALWRLGLARMTILLIPFKFIAPSLGNQGHTASEIITQQQSNQAELIGWAVRAAARRTPWYSNCLAQAIAAKRMLQHRNIPSTIYLGVKKTKDDPDKLNAHAWLACGNVILTGKGHHLTFKVITFFGDTVPTPDQ